jgi:hypothetical protein
MQRPVAVLLVLAGIGIGAVLNVLTLSPTRSASAGASDRYDNYVMCTGAVSVNPRLQTDGVWLLDYRSGKLLGTVIDKSQGRIVGWAEVDLAAEFETKPLADVHFLMTTGYITQGQAALYVAETTSGKFGVYTMGPGANGDTITIRRHDMTSFRTMSPNVLPAKAATSGAVIPAVPVGPIPGLGQPNALPSTVPATTPPAALVPTAPSATITPPATPGSGTPPPLVPVPKP